MLDQLQKPNLNYREKILELAKINPIQPTFVAKALNTNSLLASAMLSELSEKGLLAVSNLKIGSSPLYYIPAENEKLLNYIHVLNDKDRKTLTKLQAENVLRDNILDPLERVSLRNIKDFAKPLTVKYGDSQELFWKYYLTEDIVAEQLIRKLLEPQQTQIPEQLKQSQQQVSEIQDNKIQDNKLIQENKYQEKNIIEEKVKKRIIKEEKEIKPLKEIKEEIVTEENKTENIFSTNPIKLNDNFSKSVINYLNDKSIHVIQENIVKKNTEIDYVLRLPTPVGNIVYYCKATNKKRIMDADISQAFVQGQLKKLPVLFLYSGELMLKAKTILKELQGVTATKIYGC